MFLAKLIKRFKFLTINLFYMPHTESWYVYEPENRRFKKVDFSELPDYSGHIFLKREEHDHYFSEKFDLTLFSPSGEEIIVDEELELGGKESNKRYNDSLQHIANVSNNFSTGREFRFLNDGGLVPKEILSGKLKPTKIGPNEKREWEFRRDGFLEKAIYYADGYYQQTTFGWPDGHED
jgi:hypothetical protein